MALFTENLEELIFNRHTSPEFQADELIVLSGYLGPNPVSRLQTLPFNSRVIYGMYASDGVSSALHRSLISLHEPAAGLNILYSKIPVHSKCYLWLNHGTVTSALIGSANFSVNGLTTPFREVLTEIDVATYPELKRYVEFVLNNTIPCVDGGARTSASAFSIATDRCLLSFLMRGGEIHRAAGLNWGQNPDNHTNPDDAYITITTAHVRAFPHLFPPKQLANPEAPLEGGRSQRHNDAIDIIWDDGTTMRGLLEGSVRVDGVVHPKQVSSFPSKNILGLYIKDRLGLSPGEAVTRDDLVRYGRTDIEVSLISEGVYSFDFSVPV